MSKLYAAARTAVRDINEQVFNAWITNQSLPDDQKMDLDAYRAGLERGEIEKHLQACRLAFRMEMAAAEQVAWFVTIRPSPDWAGTWPDFNEACQRMISSALWTHKVWSFEQKGTSAETLGQGFHLHLVAKSSKAKKDIVKELKRRFERTGICGNAGVQVDKCKTPADVIRLYLVEYEADDGHKATTKPWDSMWREAAQLQPIYGDIAHFCGQDLPSP